MISKNNTLIKEFRDVSAYEAAIRLIGGEIERVIGTKVMRGKIVEVEAYDQSDIASHSYRGVTTRNAVMFGKSGSAYVYFTYGMHHCLNVVVGREGEGSAVLIRALEPLAGESIMKKNRSVTSTINLLNGPAKLCQALAIDKNLNGHVLSREPLRLKLNEPLSKTQIGFSSRIGIHESKNNKLLWRVFLKSSPFLSRKETILHN
jgi:DNA-3-methyladenine glycosylase